VVGDLRRVIHLVPYVRPSATPATAALVTSEGDPPPLHAVPPGLYCRALGALSGLVVPAKAEAAQVPAALSRPAQATPTLVTPGATAAVEQRVRAARQRAAIYEVEIHKKLAISAACVIFALLGVPLAIRFPRGGVGLVIGTSLAVFSIYYVGLIGGEELGDRLVVSPFLAMWTPNLIFTVAGLTLLAAVRREGSTAQGGDWDELRDALFGWISKLGRRRP